MRMFPDPDDVIELTLIWEGERFEDGRPKVPDDDLRALSELTHEEVWDVLNIRGYEWCFAGGWKQTNPDKVLVGRAVTAHFMPFRPDLDAAMVVAAGETLGSQNTWVIETLTPGDVMVADIHGKIREGTVIGDRLATAIVARTGRGAVIDGGVRSVPGISALDATFFYRDSDPTGLRNVTVAAVNGPVQVGDCTVLPGDVVLGNSSGITFIPPHLVGDVLDHSRTFRLRDAFGKQRLAEGRYQSAEIDTRAWSRHIERDFAAWREAQEAARAEH